MATLPMLAVRRVLAALVLVAALVADAQFCVVPQPDAAHPDGACGDAATLAPGESCEPLCADGFGPRGAASLLSLCATGARAARPLARRAPAPARPGTPTICTQRGAPARGPLRHRRLPRPVSRPAPPFCL
jgi:hypothetical protein